MINYENYDPFFPDQPVVDLYLPLWSTLPSFHSKPAFIWSDDGGSSSTLTYGDLNNSIYTISTNLLTQLKRRDTIIILCSPGLELVEVIFACQRAGLLGVPIVPPDPTFSDDNYHHLVRALMQTKPKAAIADSGYIQRVRQYCSSAAKDPLSQILQKLKWISATEIKQYVNSKSNDLGWYSGCKADEAYLIQYTSGATGIPKPVILTAGAAAHNVRMARRAYDLHPNSVIVSWLPQYHDCGLMFLLLTVVSGATCVLTSPTAFVTRPRLWLELITEYKATCTPVPSFTLPLVLKRGGVSTGIVPLDLRSMKNLIIINEPIYKASIDEFVAVFVPFGLNACSISPSYGLAEHCTFVSTAWRSGDHGDSFPTHKNLFPSARLSSRSSDVEEEDDVEIVVVNEETHTPVIDGVEGEIWISSVSNASGYLGHPSLTRDVFQRRLSNKVSRCFVRTGDRGVVKGEDRYLFVTGRSSDIIKLENGREIHPHYIETSAYNSCTQLLRGGCIAAFEVSRTVVVVAEMQRNGKGKKICEGIRECVMNEEKIEVGLVVLVKSGNVPKTTSGKIQRWAAKNKLLSGNMDVVIHMKFGESETVNSELMSKLMIMSVNEKKVEKRNVEIHDEAASDNQMLLLLSNPQTTPFLHSSL